MKRRYTVVAGAGRERERKTEGWNRRIVSRSKRRSTYCRLSASKGDDLSGAQKIGTLVSFFVFFFS